MSESSNVSEMYEMKTSIALIQKDIKNIEKYFSEIEKSMSKINDVDKSMIIHKSILEGYEKRLNVIEMSILTYSKSEQELRQDFAEKITQFKEDNFKSRSENYRELSSNMENLVNKLTIKIEALEEKIAKMENFRWYAMGIVAVIVFILGAIPIPPLF
jgi:chromosome segregation ATPase